MRPIDWKKVPKQGRLVLLTTEDIYVDQPMMMADFKDTHALFHTKTKRWLGLSRERGIRLCHGQADLMEGIWFVREDFKGRKLHENITIKISDLSLEIIR